MIKLNPYLNFNGTTEEAFNFYKSVFGAELMNLTRFKDIPGGDQMPAEHANLLMHVALPIGNGIILMGTDAVEGMGQHLVEGNNISLSINTDSKEEADTLFNKLSVGGKIGSPMKDEFWGDYFGMFTDKFGINWMISFSKKQS